MSWQDDSRLVAASSSEELFSLWPEGAAKTRFHLCQPVVIPDDQLWGFIAALTERIGSDKRITSQLLTD